MTWLLYLVLFVSGTWALTEAWPFFRSFLRGLTRPKAQLPALLLILLLTGWIGGVLFLIAILVAND